MNYKESILKQFEELIATGKRVEGESDGVMELELDKTPENAARLQRYSMDREGFSIRAMQLISRVSGKDSPHSKRIEAVEAQRRNYPYSTLNQHLGVLEAAKMDFDAEQFTDIRRLVRADLLDDFLSQAGELLASGFSEASVSLGGAVLEDTLRKLCDKHSIPYAQKTAIDTLNISLAKAQVYDGLVQKRITQIAHLRNDADHGRSLGTVKPADAEDMLKWLRRFVTDYLN